MKKLLLSIGIASAIPLSTHAIPDGHVWFPFGGSEYALSLQPVSWWDGYDEASSVSAHLATIGSAAENAFISSLSEGDLWIGYTDEEVEGDFEWVDLSDDLYTNWAVGEPNNLGDEDYTVINWSAPGNWNDLPGENLNYAVLERELQSQPVPEVQTYATMFGAALIGLRALRRKLKA